MGFVDTFEQDFLEKLVKSHQGNLFLAGFSHLELQCLVRTDNDGIGAGGGFVDATLLGSRRYRFVKAMLLGRFNLRLNYFPGKLFITITRSRRIRFL